jgi:hypothetical protein
LPESKSLYRSRIRDSSSSSLNARTVTIRVHHLIVIFLVIVFGMTARYTISNLRVAFRAAYQEEVVNRSGQNADASILSDAEQPFHIEYFSPQVARWGSSIVSWSDEFNLPPDLIAIVMQIESCGDPQARSGAGAMGIFQVMPFHFVQDEDPYDPIVNAYRGLDFLAGGYARSGGEIDRTLAGYNGGHSLIELQAHAWPQETKRYVSWGVGLWDDIQDGRYPSPTLERWMQAGGARLCSEAAATILQHSQSY